MKTFSYLCIVGKPADIFRKCMLSSLDRNLDNFFASKMTQYNLHLVMHTALGSVSIRVWGIVYLMQGPSRTSIQISGILHTFYM